MCGGGVKTALRKKSEPMIKRKRTVLRMSVGGGEYRDAR